MLCSLPLSSSIHSSSCLACLIIVSAFIPLISPSVYPCIISPSVSSGIHCCASLLHATSWCCVCVAIHPSLGVKVRQSTSRRFSDLIPQTSSSDLDLTHTAPENQSSDPTEVISPSRARAMFTEMEQKRALSPASSDSHSHRSMSPPSQRTMSPSHKETNHREEPIGRKDPVVMEEDPVGREEDASGVPYREMERVSIYDSIPE